jgi:erythromycin esterase-like protein
LNKLLEELKSNIEKSSTDKLKKEHKVNNLIYNNILDIENYLETTKKTTKSIREILFNGKNTYINYLNIKNQKPIQSRDEIMADRISFLAKNSDGKIIVWAHNAHISNEIITDNEIGIMGRDLKKEFDSDYYTIGLTTLKGSYAYVDGKFINGDHLYTEKLKTESFQPVDSLFWEKKLSQNGNSFVMDMSDLKNQLTTDEIIGATRLIGYSKESKEDIYYLPLIKNFDTMIFIEETNSTKPIFE